MSKQMITGIVAALMLIVNIFLVYRVHSNNMTIAAYDAGISQRSGVGQLESFWTKYIGGSKNSSITYEDREDAEFDTTVSVAVLFVLDIAGGVALYMLNKKPKPAPVVDDYDEWPGQRKSRRRRY